MLAVQALELTLIGVVFNTVATKIAATMARRPYRTMIHTLTTAPPDEWMDDLFRMDKRHAGKAAAMAFKYRHCSSMRAWMSEASKVSRR